MKQLNKPQKSNKILASFDLFWVWFNQIYIYDIIKSLQIAHGLLDALQFNHYKKEKGMGQWWSFVKEKLCAIPKNSHLVPEGHCCPRRYTSKISDDNDKFSINKYYHLKDTV